LLSTTEWVAPSFVQIRKKITKRISPYIENELWERDEIITIISYEPYKRNKAALALLWDLDARNHEITLLKIKHIRLKDKYGEGEIPHETKTGTGPILLTCSFPYVREWLNEHPFKNEPNARLICNLYNGSPITADSLWTVMKQLRKRIIRLIETGCITDNKERQRLEFLLKTKKWNPYCIRHSGKNCIFVYIRIVCFRQFTNTIELSSVRINNSNDNCGVRSISIYKSVYAILYFINYPEWLGGFRSVNRGYC
jgi:hypothetical protein